MQKESEALVVKKYNSCNIDGVCLIVLHIVKAAALSMLSDMHS